jgi:hypothetical protein
MHMEELSSVARLADAASCGRLALVELHWRGSETAHTVGAVSDGVEWKSASPHSWWFQQPPTSSLDPQQFMAAPIPNCRLTADYLVSAPDVE